MQPAYEEQTALSKEYSESYTYDITYYGCIKLTDKSGNIAYLSSAGVKYIYSNKKDLYTTAGEQIFTVPITGTYKLEAWGAQGWWRSWYEWNWWIRWLRNNHYP